MRSRRDDTDDDVLAALASLVAALRPGSTLGRVTDSERSHYWWEHNDRSALCLGVLHGPLGHTVPIQSTLLIKVTDIVTSVRSTLERLGDLADSHGGYFTTAEAAAAGLSRRALSHHATVGTLERVGHGIYRLRLYPASRFEDLIVATLWGDPDSAVSHESALVVHGLGDAMPPVVHLTVARPFRGRRPGVVVHHRPLEADDRVVVDAVAVTSVERTLADVAESSDPALVRAAVHEALDRGRTTRRRLERAVSDPAARDLLLRAR